MRCIANFIGCINEVLLEIKVNYFFRFAFPTVRDVLETNDERQNGQYKNRQFRRESRVLENNY